MELSRYEKINLLTLIIRDDHEKPTLESLEGAPLIPFIRGERVGSLQET